MADDILNRYIEFQDFERKFEECISKSAVRTKFEGHSQRGKRVVSEMQKINDRMYDQAQLLKTQKTATSKEIYDKLNIIEQQLLPIVQEMEDKIRQMVEDVKQRVSCFRGTSVTCTEGTQWWVHVVLMSPCLLHQTSVCNEHCRATN